MEFMIDRVSEDSYYVNLLLGLPHFLDRNKRLRVKHKRLKRNNPISHSDMCAWENKQGILLPEDLRNFYSCTNGFLFGWTFNLMHERKKIFAKIEVNSLDNLVQMYGFETSEEGSVSFENDGYVLKLGMNSKIFELVSINDRNKVVLVYLNSRFAPTIWVYNQLQGFDFLADDFTTYFRMALTHLGLPSWQLLFTIQAVPHWTNKMMRIVAPGLLKTRKLTKTLNRKQCKIITSDNVVINKLDINVFKLTQKTVPIFPHILPKDRIKTQSNSPSPRLKKKQFVRTKIHSRFHKRSNKKI